MQGYVGPPEKTTSAMLDGFFKSGDVGYIDERGFIFLVDRVKELIKVKGYVFINVILLTRKILQKEAAPN